MVHDKSIAHEKNKLRKERVTLQRSAQKSDDAEKITRWPSRKRTQLGADTSRNCNYAVSVTKTILKSTRWYEREINNETVEKRTSFVVGVVAW